MNPPKSKQEERIAFEPRSYQKEVYDAIKNRKSLPLLPHRGRSTFIGYDMARLGSKDRSVITRWKLNGRGEIVIISFDEFDQWPTYKWYRNPIKWWKWRQLFKRVGGALR